MKSDLDLIIEFYENEKRFLEQEIKEALAEHDYEVIYHRGKALNRVEAQLYRMNGFKDPFYEKRLHISRLREWMPAEEIDEFLKQYLIESTQQKIANEKQSLEKLLEQKQELIDSQEIDDALFDLDAGKYKAFGFSFPHRDDNLCLLFELTTEKMLLISVEIKDITSEDDPDDPEEKQIHLFLNLDFHPDNYGASLVYKYDMSNFKSAWQIKILLARIVYDIGYFGQGKIGALEFYS